MVSGALDRAADHITAALLGAAQAAHTTQVSTGKVTAVAAGRGVGGVALVTVSWQGGTVTIPHSGAYIPAVGDQVSLLRPGRHQLLINDKIIGGPPRG